MHKAFIMETYFKTLRFRFLKVMTKLRQVFFLNDGFYMEISELMFSFPFHSDLWILVTAVTEQC